ncbi:MAG TPA: DUF748 domain-containing protein [Thermoanaerobaculia bacterium]|nr:DUF748 domain-containing protein [Thermoanaerobaculia bacterium]
MSHRAFAPREHHEPIESIERETPAAPPPAAGRPREPLGRRGLLWTIALCSLALLLLFVAQHFDEYLRRTLETKINQRLHGYAFSLGGAHLNPFGLALTLERGVIRQQANPEPPVADIPRLTASVEWREILHGHLVANARFDGPRIHVNLPQLRQEDRDQVDVQNRGWQQALESIYPLKFNLLEVSDGDIVYIDEDPERPLHISRWNLSASNIRNIRSDERIYPSPIHTDGVIFDTGRGVLDGHADFLAEPFPGVHAIYQVDNVPLDRLRPLSARANLSLSGGVLASRGEFEYGPKHREVRIDDVTAKGLRLDYIHTAATADAEEARGRQVAEAARDAQPGMLVRIQRLQLVDGKLGLVSEAKDRRFRVFVDHTNLEVTNLSSGFRQGPAKASFKGRFMGSGAASGSAIFRDDHAGPDFNLTVAIEKASLPSINELLRAYGKLDVAEGSFSVYSEVKVRNGRIEGYLKPLFADVKVYDPQQDKKKPILKKLYEKVVGGLSHILENRPRDQVATVADLSGTLEDPNTSAWEIAVRLVSNAFVKAILPGFDREIEAARKR